MKFHLSRNETIQDELKAARDFYARHLEDYLDDNVVVTLGGDGTLLHAFSVHGPEAVYLPLNYGTRGYLTNRSMPRQDLVRIIQAGETKLQGFSTLESNDLYAFNEIAFQATGGQSARLNIRVNGYPLTHEPLVGSGAIVYTPQGSTGWAMSAGAACMSPEIHGLIGIVPICAYQPRIPPILVPADSYVIVEAEDPEHRPVTVLFDGRPVREMASHEAVSIRVPQDPVKVMYLADHNFTRRMISKVVV